MNRIFAFVFVLAVTGCEVQKTQPNPGDGLPIGPQAASLTEARKGFPVTLRRRASANEAVPAPPPKVFRAVQYEAPLGRNAAYLTPDPKDGQLHPAIIWITGGDCNTIGDVWSAAPANNDQTAAAFRQAGIVMMFPSLRGGNRNPGVVEGFLGEVDDVIAAADYLAKQPYVDPTRIYLGGHSTGGTLALLVAECSGQFRAVFSFGPADDVSNYGEEYTPFDPTNPREVAVRSPGRWLHTITSPTFVFEGTVRGNLDSLQAMAGRCQNPNVQFFPVRGGSHFDILAPLNRFLADKILKDVGPTTTLKIDPVEVARAFGR